MKGKELTEKRKERDGNEETPGRLGWNDGESPVETDWTVKLVGHNMASY